jgi:tRNA dimethylallyltransferase
MVDEAIKLHNSGLSFERMDELGLEYRYLAKLMQGELKNDEFIEILNTKIWQFARRQKTWFRKNAQIKWFDPTTLADIKDEIVRSL